MPFPTPGGGGSSSSLTITITQTAHGFTVGQWVYLSAASTYALTDADLSQPSDSIGVVSAVINANNFTLLTSGYVIGLTGLTAAEPHFLSGTPGTITATEPTNPAQIRKPVLIADTTTSGWVIDRSGTPVVGQTAVVNSGVNTTITNNTSTGSLTFVDVPGGSFVLPVAGTYKVTYSVPCLNAAANGVFIQLADSANVSVPNSIAFHSLGSANNYISISQAVLITVTAATTYKLQFRVGGGTGFIANSTANGNATIVWTQLGGTPVPMSLAGEYGENVGITDAQSITSAAFVDVTNGSFNLPTAGVWEVTYHMFSLASATGQNKFVITDTANALVPNSQGAALGSSGPVNTIVQASNTVYLTTSGSTTYKMRWLAVGGLTAVLYNNSNTVSFGGNSKVTWRKVSGFIPTTGSTVDYVNARITSSTTILAAAANTAAANIPFATYSGNIPNTSGVFSLTAGKTYAISGRIYFAGSVGAASNGYLVYKWVDAVTGSALDATSGSGIITSSNGTTPYAQQNQASIVYTPVANQTIVLRLFTFSSYTSVSVSSGTGANAESSATIVQIGSTATTLTTRVNVINRGKTVVNSMLNNTWVKHTNWINITDPTNSMNVATGVFTAPRTANYSFTGGNYIPNNASGQYAGLSVYKNAVTQLYSVIFVVAGPTNYPSTSGVIELAAGDTLELRGYNGGATANGNISASDNWFTITEINPTF